jgi:ornithine cyclodeaminase/alanine dehydrogenase-like protein (mu-crystallin family)
MGEEILYLSESDVRECLSMGEAINEVEKAIKLLAEGKAIQPPKIYMSIPGHHGFVKPMTAYVEPMGVAVSKIFTFFPDNPTKHGLPTVHATIIVNDAETGAPVALMDGNWITGLRTAATSAIAAKYLAKKDSHVIGIIGNGYQGRTHLEALGEVCKVEEVHAFDTFDKTRDRYVAEMRNRGFNVKPAASYQEAVLGSDIVVTCTAGDEVMVRPEWYEPGMFIAKVGSYQELDTRVVTDADKVVVDWWDYVSSRVKELNLLAEKGLFNRGKVYAEIHEVVGGLKPGRENPDEKTLFISIGMGVEDAAAAVYAIRRANKLGIGTKIKR